MILTVWLLALSGPAGGQLPPPCAAAEIVRGEDEYNKLVCHGKSLLERGLHGEAMRVLEAADAVGFFEAPNYQVLALLAKAQLLAGYRPRAEETLKVARLSLLLVAQVVRCSDSGSSPIALMHEEQRLVSTAAMATAERMCGGIYEAYYEHRPSLEVFRRDAERIRGFLHIQAEFAAAGLAVDDQEHTSGQKHSSCSGVELIEGQDAHNALVCEGKRLLETGRYQDAIKQLEVASNMRFVDIPNYRVLPLLARAHLMAGNRLVGNNVLQEARLSLSLIAQVLYCRDASPHGDRILVGFGDRRLTSTAAAATEVRMCGRGHSAYYRQSRPSFGAFLRDADLVHEFLRTESEFAASAR